MPGFQSWSNLTGKYNSTLFEIKLDNEVVVLRGSELEASSQLLKGVVVLTLPTPLKVDNVHLRMTGHLKIAWNDTRVTPTGSNTIRVSQSTEIFTHRWPPFVGGTSSKGVTLAADTHTWPFELVIPGSFAQSVEGMRSTHIIYKLKATVARGKLAHDLHAWKPVRIVRTLNPATDLEMAHTMLVENIWPNKVEYELSIPRKAVILGTAMDIRMRFTLLLKGLRIGQIQCTLLELQDFTLPPSGMHGQRSFHHARDVQSWLFEVDPDTDYRDPVNDAGQDGYVLEKTVVLTRNLSRYVQDVDVHGIKIRHRVRFNIALLNPDGHVSELRAALPVIIFISPDMPRFDANGCFVRHPGSMQTIENVSTAPPCYGDHVLDELYADLDQSAYMTPLVRSGMNTPSRRPSRTNSVENLAALRNGNSMSNEIVTPGALSSRLHSLSLSRNNGHPRRSSGHLSDQSTSHTPHEELPTYPHHDTPPSHRTSHTHRQGSTSTNGEVDITGGADAGRPHTPEYGDLADLNKVPSYTTAIRTPPRNWSSSETVPNYALAVSTPPSPVRRFSAPVSTIQENGDESSPGRALSSVGFVPLSGMTR